MAEVLTTFVLRPFSGLLFKAQQWHSEAYFGVLIQPFLIDTVHYFLTLTKESP